MGSHINATVISDRKKKCKKKKIKIWMGEKIKK